METKLPIEVAKDYSSISQQVRVVKESWLGRLQYHRKQYSRIWQNILYIQNGVVKSKHEVLNRWSRTNFVKNTSEIEAIGWLLDILVCIERVRKKEFSLQELYRFEEYLKTKLHQTIIFGQK